MPTSILLHALLKNDLVRDLILGKQFADLLGSRLNQSNPLALGIMLILMLSSKLVIQSFFSVFIPLVLLKNSVPFDTNCAL